MWLAMWATVVPVRSRGRLSASWVARPRSGSEVSKRLVQALLEALGIAGFKSRQSAFSRCRLARNKTLTDYEECSFLRKQDKGEMLSRSLLRRRCWFWVD